MAKDIHMVGLGKALELTYYDDGISTKYKPAPQTYFGWYGGAKDGSIFLLRVPRSAFKQQNLFIDNAPQVTKKMHQEFHNVETVKSIKVDRINDIVEALNHDKQKAEILGYVKEIVYHTNSHFEDSAKQGLPYRHKFGDFGDGNDQSNNPKYWPYFAQIGHTLVILRRPGNAFTLDSYVRG